jgi:hypothetical protein
MRIGWRTLFLTIVLAGSCLAANPPKPPDQRVLPTVQLSSSTGSVVNVADMGNTGHWLLLYVHARNESGQMLLKQLKADKYGALTSQIVVIVGGINADALAEWAKRFPDLASARWLADPKDAAARALDLHGVPVELGLKDNAIEWQFSGAARDNEMFDATLLNWLKQTN